MVEINLSFFLKGGHLRGQALTGLGQPSHSEIIVWKVKKCFTLLGFFIKSLWALCALLKLSSVNVETFFVDTAFHITAEYMICPSGLLIINLLL